MKLEHVTFTGPPLDDGDLLDRLPANLAGLEGQVSAELILFANVVHEHARDLLDTARRELEKLTPDDVAEGMGRIYGFLLYTAAGMLLSAGAAAALKEARIVALVQRLKQLPGLKSHAAQKVIDKLFEALRLLKPRKPVRIDPNDPPVLVAPRLTAKRVEEATEIADNLFVDVAPTTNAASQINPRLTQRLEAFRAYKANGGTMDMAQWVKHTKANPNWGTGPNSGYAKWIRSVESVHGNSKLSPQTAYLYRLEDANGNLLKWGITQDLNSRYPQSFLLDKRLIEVGKGNRADILRWERDLVETQPGPLNFEPWAGSRANP